MQIEFTCTRFTNSAKIFVNRPMNDRIIFLYSYKRTESSDRIYSFKK